MNAAAWRCFDCAAVVELDRHGRCSVCGSDAIDIAVRPEATVEGLASAYLTVIDLEAMAKEPD